MINLPIFRAKRINSDEYVFGVPRQDSKGMFEMIINVVEDGIPGVIQRYIEVDTISIHFPDMLDSRGNKIFASLQEDGKGGDVVTILDTTFIATYKYIKGKFLLDNNMNTFNPYVKFKTVGIQQ